MGPGSILQERRHSQLEDITAENGAWPHLFRGMSPKIKAAFPLWERSPKQLSCRLLGYKSMV